MSVNVHSFRNLAERGWATFKCQGMSTHLDIWRTEAKLPVNVRECPHGQSVGEQGLTYQQMSGNVHSFRNLANWGRATNKCKGMSKNSDICRTGAKLPVLLSGNVHSFWHLADKGRATSKCQGMSTQSDSWLTGADLWLNVRKFPPIRSFGGQGPSYQ